MDERTKHVFGFIGIAYQDYLGARLLLQNGLLPQGGGLATASVEKYLKGVVLLKGNRCRGHLEQNLLNAVKNQQPEMYGKLNLDFIRFLRKLYKLRYHDDKKEKFSLVINQYRTLAELDETISIIDSGFRIQKGNQVVDTAYRKGIKDNEPLLVSENYLIEGVSRRSYFERRNKIFEIVIEPDSSGLTVTYFTDRVNDDGSFLKPPDLSTKKSKIQLTFG